MKDYEMKFKKGKTMLGRKVLSLYLFVQSLNGLLLAGTVELGMGQVGVAYPQTTDAGMFNPAGMVEIGNRVDVNAGVFCQNGKVKVSGNAGPQNNGKFNPVSGMPCYPVGTLGVNKMLTDEISVGIIVSSKANPIKTSYSKPFPLSGTTKLGSEHLQLLIAPTIAAKTPIGDVGISLLIAAQRAMVNGFQNLEAFTAYPGKVTNRGYNYSYGYGVSIGWLGQLHPCLTVGLRYDSKVSTGAFKKYRGFCPIKGRIDYPARWAGGIAFKFLPEATLAFDVEYVVFSQVPVYSNHLYPNIFIYPQGVKRSAGHQFPNRWIYHLGIDYELNCNLKVRAGWAYLKSPVIPRATFANMHTLSTIEHTLTLGGTWQYNCSLEFSCAYAHGFRHNVKGKNSLEPPFGGGEVDIASGFDVLLVGAGMVF